MTTELQKTELNFLDQLESPERSICGGVQFADIDQHGGVYSARMPAQSVPGGSELLPGVQAPRESLSPRRQVGKVGAADWLLADVQGDLIDLNSTDGPDVATGDRRRDLTGDPVSRRGDGPPLTHGANVTRA